MHTGRIPTQYYVYLRIHCLQPDTKKNRVNLHKDQYQTTDIHKFNIRISQKQTPTQISGHPSILGSPTGQ